MMAPTMQPPAPVPVSNPSVSVYPTLRFGLTRAMAGGKMWVELLGRA